MLVSYSELKAWGNQFVTILFLHLCPGFHDKLYLTLSENRSSPHRLQSLGPIVVRHWNCLISAAGYLPIL